MDNNSTLFHRLNALADSDAVPMHMPGHKRNTGDFEFLKELGARYDITEIEGFDDLHDPRGILNEAMARAARLWKSERSFFLVNGSTGGILAAIRAASQGGTGKLIMARNCHRSVYNAALLCALEPVYILPDNLKGFGFCGSIPPKAVEKAVRENPGAAVVLTSPTYEGVISNNAEIAVICHMHGSPLIVDEAHGAHLDLSPHFTGGAVRAGADIVVQSVHKTLTGLNQAGLLHVCGALISSEDAARELAVFQTSSPSYPIMASIDSTVDLIENRGRELFKAWKKRFDRFDSAVSPLENISLPGHSELFECQSGRRAAGYKRMGLGAGAVFGFDRSKIIISCEGTDTTGPSLMRALRQRFNIECEMAAGGYCIAMSGILDRDEHMERLAAALCELDGEIRRTAPRLPLQQAALPPRRMRAEIALSEPCRSISLYDAKGKIAAEYVWAYPPGVPLVVPGEELTEGLLGSFIIHRDTGVSLKSSSGGMPRTIRVIK